MLTNLPAPKFCCRVHANAKSAGLLSRPSITTHIIRDRSGEANTRQLCVFCQETSKGEAIISFDWWESSDGVKGRNAGPQAIGGGTHRTPQQAGRAAEDFRGAGHSRHRDVDEAESRGG